MRTLRRPPEAMLPKAGTKTTPSPTATKISRSQRRQKKKCLPHRVKNPKATTLAINPMRAAKGAPKCVGPAATRRVSLLNGDAAVDVTVVVAEAEAASKKADRAAENVPSACRFRRSATS